MALLNEDDKDVERMRSNNDRLMFLNNQLQRYALARCFTLAEAEQAISKIRDAIKGAKQ